MEWIKAENSSNVAEYGYEPAAAPEDGGILGMRFKNETEYHYAAVPTAHFEGMKTAESVGKYFAAHIRGKYAATKIN